jgi:hypothetical protein
MQKVEQGIQNKNTEHTTEFGTINKALYRAPAIPQGFDIEGLETDRSMINKIMMKYIE